MLSRLCVFHFAQCTAQGIKARSENKVTGLAHWSLVTPCYSFIHSPPSSILRVSLDSAEAGPQHWLIGKDSDAGRDWGQEEEGTTEDEMVGWHHQLNGRGFGWTPGVADGQGGLTCCGSWGRKESDTTERLNWTELNWWAIYSTYCVRKYIGKSFTIITLSPQMKWYSSQQSDFLTHIYKVLALNR